MLEGAPQGSWKLLAALCVCFLEGDLFVGVFIGTCEEISLENSVCGLCAAVCVGLPRSVVYGHRADACFSGRSMSFLGRRGCVNDAGGDVCCFPYPVCSV